MKNMLLLVITIFFSASAFAIDPTSTLPADVKKKHLQMSSGECADDLPSAAENFDLGNEAQLYIVPCYLGAYQGASYIYAVDKFNNITPVILLSYNDYTEAIVGSMEHTSAQFDKNTMQISTFSKGRGLGDCGETTLSKVVAYDDGYVSVKTIQIRAKAECDGDFDATWPVVFKQ